MCVVLETRSKSLFSPSARRRRPRRAGTRTGSRASTRPPPTPWGAACGRGASSRAGPGTPPPVQRVAAFPPLGEGDILFIDSSHQLKPGSDVEFLLKAVLPMLPAGVRVHFHDIFLPDDYPASWA